MNRSAKDKVEPTRSRLGQLATIVVAVYWIAMFTGTHIPRPERIIGPDVSDKLLHFSAYFVLYLLLVGRLRIIRRAWPVLRTHFTLVVLCGVYAVLDELLQGFPGVNRSPEVADAVADFGGVLGAQVIALITARLFPVKSSIAVDVAQ